MCSMLTRRTLHQEGPVKEEDANVEEVGNIETDEDVLLRV
jgi:hypothetical protein